MKIEKRNLILEVAKIHLIVLTQSHKSGYEFGEFDDILYHCCQFFSTIQPEIFLSQIFVIEYPGYVLQMNEQIIC